MLTIAQQETLATNIVARAKAGSNRDTGALIRSISFGYVGGVLTFRQLYYGQWNDNSPLEKLATALIPKDTPWKIIYTTFGGATYTKTIARSGRKLSNGIKPKKSTGTGPTRSSTTNLNNLIRLVNDNRKKAKLINDSGDQS